MPKLSTAEKKLLVYLHAIDGVGQGRLRELIKKRQKSKQNLLNIWSNGQGAAHFIKDKKTYQNYQTFKLEYNINSYWHQLEKKQIKTLFLGDRLYPSLLKVTAFAPAVLYLWYQHPQALKLLQSRLPVAVVGTRKITQYGRYVTKKITTELANLGAVVVSGFMYGVDTYAHEAAIAAGGGTIAVLGFGFDHIYPASHQAVFERLSSEKTLFISQFPPHTQAHPGNFPARNATVAGLSLGVVVTEAAEKSGSHITAQLALDEGRVVMAVPGPIDNPYSQGTKWLINQGAVLVTSGEEVLREVGWKGDQKTTLVAQAPPSSSAPLEFDSDEEKRLYELVLSQVVTADEIADELGFEISRVNLLLTSLELKGAVKRVGVKWEGVRG